MNEASSDEMELLISSQRSPIASSKKPMHLNSVESMHTYMLPTVQSNMISGAGSRDSHPVFTNQVSSPIATFSINNDPEISFSDDRIKEESSKKFTQTY